MEWVRVVSRGGERVVSEGRRVGQRGKRAGSGAMRMGCGEWGDEGRQQR